MKVPKARKLPSGMWNIQLRLDGQSISITRKTEKECFAAAAAVKAGLAEEKKKPSVLKLTDAYTRYIDMKDGILSPSTIAGYKRQQKNTLQGIMNKDINALTNEMIQLEVKKMSVSKKSPKYIANATGLLSSVLKTFRPDFVLRITLPQKIKAEQRALSNDEIKQLCEVVKGSEIELPVLMAVWLGMRMSEIIGAEYEDIKDHKLHICRAVVLDSERKAVSKPPKTFSGDRWVSLPPYIEKLIGGGTGRIVPLSAATIYKRMVVAMKDAGMQPCRFHDLRHANAAIMIQLGIDSRYAQERNGWKSEYMYKQVYGYTVDKQVDLYAKKIDTFFANKVIGKGASRKQIR